MARFLLPLLLASFSLANAKSVTLADAKPVTVECSDGQVQFELSDLKKSKCLRIARSDFMPLSLLFPLIDTKSLGLFIKLSKLNDDKIFTFIDSLSPEAFRIIDYYAKYLQVYHEFDALFKYKCLKEYSLQGANKTMCDFVDSKFFILKFVEDAKSGTGKWKQTNLFDLYFGPEFSMFMGSITNDVRAFFVLIDFYQQTIKKPLPLTTDHLKNLFNSFDPVIQDQLVKKKLVTVSQ